MNQTSHISLATLHFGDGEFVVLKGGSHVRCAISGEAIPLAMLRYWSAERQEAYRGPLECLSAQQQSYADLI